MYWLIHSGPEHAAMNIVAFAFMIRALGLVRGAVSFAFGVFGAWLAFVIFSSGTLIGASGGIFGMLVTFWYMHPQHKVLIFGIIVGETYLAVTDPLISTVAHAGGAFAGTLPLYYWRLRDSATST